MARSARRRVGILFGLAIALGASLASAQDAPAAPAAGGGGAGVKTTGAAPSGKEAGYGYEFTDDPLNAGGFGPNDATIRVRPGPVRTTLIRPRTSFVPEMLKSVENL
jgi:hypothetical protein